MDIDGLSAELNPDYSAVGVKILRIAEQRPQLTSLYIDGGTTLPGRGRWIDVVTNASNGVVKDFIYNNL